MLFSRDNNVHHIEYIFQIGGAFCLTEIGHGTNTKAMRTEASFDVKTQQFVLHTPDFQAAKCWAGNLGKINFFFVLFLIVILCNWFSC